MPPPIYNGLGNAVTVTLNALVITNGSGVDGGGIGVYIGDTVTLDGSTITGNTASDADGGIYNFCGGTLNGAVDGGNVYNNQGCARRRQVRPAAHPPARVNCHEPGLIRQPPFAS